MAPLTRKRARATAQDDDDGMESTNGRKKIGHQPKKERRNKSRPETHHAVIEIPSRTPSPVPAVIIDTCEDRSPPEDLGPPYDVCFGMLLLEATCHDDPASTPQAPVKISTFGSFLMLQYEETDKSAGSLISSALARLINQKLVHHSASLGAETKATHLRLSNIRLWPRTLRVTLYGRLEKKDQVTEILDSENLFLQRPDVSTYDRRVRYFNPMYLLPPGADMTRLGALSTLDTSRATSVESEAESVLGEYEKRQVLQIFDQASGTVTGGSLRPKQSPRITSQLQDHQLEALAMMMEKERPISSTNSKFPLLWEPFTSETGVKQYRHIVTKTVQQLPLPSLHGGILADEMGLGKTLSALALICSQLDNLESMNSQKSSPKAPCKMSKATLVVAPLSLMYGWQKQIEHHIRPGGLQTLVYHGPMRQEQATTLHDHDVVLTTYETLRSDWASYGPLYTSTWARVMLDEAHKVRNPTSTLFDAVCQIPARNRWCLTGTPIQNSLEDFGSLLAFVGVPPFVTRDQFRCWVSRPTLNNRDAYLHSLRRLVAATCLRRTKALPRLAKSLKLPPKVERVQVVELSDGEREVYEFFKRRSYLLANREKEESGNSPTVGRDASPSNSLSPGRGAPRSHKRKRSRQTAPGSERRKTSGSGSIVVLISVLRMICNHGKTLLPQRALKAWQEHDEGIVDWTVLENAASVAAQQPTCAMCGQTSPRDETYADSKVAEMMSLSCGNHLACETCLEGRGVGDDDSRRGYPICDGKATPKSLRVSCPVNAAPSPSPSPSSLDATYEPSSKVAAVLSNLLASWEEERPRKSLIFSQWTGMLDLLTKALIPHLTERNLTYVRIDGSSSLQQRRDALDRFGSESRCLVMLASIGAVGEGVDLSTASAVHLVEPHWNPMVEAQAVDRVHRIGQKRDVAITRYIARESIEEYIQWVQNDKLRIASESLASSGPGERDNTEAGLVEERWQKLMSFLKC